MTAININLLEEATHVDKDYSPEWNSQPIEYADNDMHVTNDFKINKIFSYVSIHNKNTIEAGLHINYPNKPRGMRVPDTWFYCVPPQIEECKKYYFGKCRVEDWILFNDITDDTISGDTNA